MKVGSLKFASEKKRSTNRSSARKGLPKGKEHPQRLLAKAEWVLMVAEDTTGADERQQRRRQRRWDDVETRQEK